MGNLTYILWQLLPLTYINGPYPGCFMANLMAYPDSPYPSVNWIFVFSSNINDETINGKLPVFQFPPCPSEWKILFIYFYTFPK